MTPASLLLLVALLQAPGRISNRHPAPDTVVTTIAAAPDNRDVGLLLRIVAGVAALQLVVFGIQAWTLRNRVREIKASTDAVRDAVVAEQRAYLRITIDAWPHPGAFADGIPDWTVKVTNSGRTLARAIRARFEYALFEDTALVKGMAIEGSKSRWGVLESGATIDVPLVGGPVPRQQWPLLEAGSGHTLFVYGEVAYTDLFGTERQSAFCRHVNWRNGEMVTVVPGYGNEFT